MRVFFIALLVMGVAACGGGGSSDLPDVATPTPEPSTPTPEPTATPDPVALDLPEITTLSSGVQQLVFSQDSRMLIMHVLGDDMIHLNYRLDEHVASFEDLISDSVANTQYGGAEEMGIEPQAFSTSNFVVSVDDQLCVSIGSPADETLTKTCAPVLQSRQFQFSIESPETNQAYGLGEQFFDDGMNGDWLGKRRTPGTSTGNRMVGFSGGAVGNLLIPVLLTHQSGQSVGYFVDAPEAQQWDLRSDTWTVGSNSSSASMFIFVGEDLADIRTDYMIMTGTPPVPPRSAFGLWVSEFGYDNWSEAEEKVIAQQSAQMPLDGIVLDLQWFGGINNRQMGSLTWDLNAFPDPASRIAAWQDNWGIKTVVIEESYIDTQTDSHSTLEQLGYMVRECEGCDPTFFDEWWGAGGMFDWSHREGAAYWHEQKRTPLIEAGVLGHWTDLGEPENFDPNGWYADTYNQQRHDHASIHNLYNFYWSQSIFEGYQNLQPDARPWILSRSGTAGSQRFGVNLWSGDIGTNALSLESHIQTQMHMSMSGIDYYGSDVGGFHRGFIDPTSLDALYSVWLANGALMDIPLRPHTENLCNCKETAPALIGQAGSNRFNLQLRYRLFPYYYSLAHKAYLEGAAMFPPLAYYHPDDENVFGIGETTYIGPSLVARSYSNVSGSDVLPTYLPEGMWFDVHNHIWIESSGESVDLNKESLGFITLPLLAKAGAIIPQMYVDDQTMNIHGLRRDASTRNELIVWTTASDEDTSFVLYEDDGVSSGYLTGAFAQTQLRRTSDGGNHSVTIEATMGTYADMLESRSYHVVLFVQEDTITSVTLNDVAMTVAASQAEYESLSQAAFQVAPGHWIAKSDEMSAALTKQFRFVVP